MIHNHLHELIGLIYLKNLPDVGLPYDEQLASDHGK